MSVLLIAVLSGLGFIVAYHTYGRWLGQRIFRLSINAVCPSHRVNDGLDYVPTPKTVVFGHHFTSIAGTGPIVGPAIAVIWGWLPALLWVFLGSIFIGAVHDLGALVVSLRNNGQTVGDIAGRVLNRRVRLLFLLVLFMALTIVLAIFGMVIAAVFRMFPASIFPCLVQIPLALGIGLWLHRKGVNLTIPSLIALGLMYLSVYYGDRGFLHTFNESLAGWSNMTWVIVLLLYSYIASVLPVWTLLQPRDYINSLQLLTALALIMLGLFAAALFGGAPLSDGARPALEIVAPMANFQPAQAPLILPFLFITIACGAISGFHCLVSSGTSSKQLRSEPDARFVAFGGMLTEGFLATLVILACVAGLGLGITGAGGEVLTGQAAWQARYASWGAAGGLGATVGAFVDGSANFLKTLLIPQGVAVALMGVLVASFAGTTLDTACRLQRYVVQELAAALLSSRAQAGPLFHAGSQRLGLNPITWLRNRHGATILAVVVAVLLAAAPPTPPEVGLLTALSTNGPGGAWDWLTTHGGRGGLILWPLFGATNQLLGGLAFMVIAFYLWRRQTPVWFLVVPMIFMLIMPAWAMLHQLFVQAVGSETSWLAANPRNWTLIFIAVATLLLEVWMIVEAVLLWPKARGVLEEALPGLTHDGNAHAPGPGA